MPVQRTVLTIGSFDGVHRGHTSLLATARPLATTQRAKVIALAFDPHPLTAINPDAAPPRLTRWDDRRRWLLEAGADEVVRLEPCSDLLDLSPQAFIEKKVREYFPLAFVEGPDFRFGCRRAGDVNLLAQLGMQFGFETIVVEPVTAVLDDHSIVQVSSTLTRWLLKNARVRDAARLLGRPYRIGGEVVPGDRRGRTIGFSTANLKPEVMLPADGVYAARAAFPDGRTFSAAVNIGERPTFTGAARTVEAHILDAGPEAQRRSGSTWEPLPNLPEYGWRLQLDLIGWLRDQSKFAGIDALKAQLQRDCARVRELVGRDAAPLIPIEIGDVRSALVAGAVAGAGA